MNMRWTATSILNGTFHTHLGTFMTRDEALNKAEAHMREAQVGTQFNTYGDYVRIEALEGSTYNVVAWLEVGRDLSLTVEFDFTDKG